MNERRYKNKLAVVSVLCLLVPVILKGQPDNVVCNDLYNGKAEVMARTSITLAPGFKGIAGCDVKAWIDPSLAMPTLTYNPVGSTNVSNVTPDADQNYILTTTLRDATTYAGTISQTPNMQSVEYFDGLGRMVQTVVPKGSPMKKDMVTALLYDNMGRAYKEYLPYVSTENDGSFKEDAYAKCVTYYSQTSGTITGRQPDNVPYVTHFFDNSPQNRPTGDTMPGQDWSSHPTAARYTMNATTVLHWTVNSSGGFTSFSFPANSLYVNETADEDGHIARTYTDKLGQVVMKEIVDDDGALLKTSYIYDDMGLLRCVVPPKNHDNGPTPELSYYYNYDSRKRMTEKRQPGTDWIYNVYDKRDRLAMWQDGVNRSEGKWHYQLYDALNRPVVAGLITCTATAATLRDAFAAFTGTLYETFSVVNPLYGYTNTSFPYAYRPTVGTVLTANYYDNYHFKNVFSGNYNFPQVPAGGIITGSYLTEAKGLMTANLEFSASATSLVTVNYYDTKLRLLCTVSDNHLGGHNNQFFRYNFNNQVAERIETHDSPYQAMITLRYNYTYDHMGRVLAEKLSVDNNTSITLQAVEYNELGEPVNTWLGGSTTGEGFNQKLTKEYNIRGWLSRINDINDIGYDLFALDLRYQNTVMSSGLYANPCYNGNISQMYSNTRYDDKRGYGFKYDDLNRLRQANYAGGDLYWSNLSWYNTSYDYDNNGNITTLKRKREGELIDDLTYNYDTWGNKIKSIADGGSSDGYVPNTGIYSYDLNGNMTYDPSREITVGYNHLNLPVQVEFGPEDNIVYEYTANGRKLSKTVNSWHTTTSSITTDYCGSFIYTDKELSSIITTTGRLAPLHYNNEVYWKTEYNLTDHLGNVRVVFATHSNGQPEVMQQTSYYPFGYTLQQNDYYASVTSENKNLYNGKELQDDVLAGSKLDWYDYGARFYDPVVPHFLTVDPLAEEFPGWVPYHFCRDNPITRVDPDGMLDELVITGNEADKAVEQMQKATSLTLTKDSNGKVSAEGEAKTQDDKKLLAVINSTDITVNVEANNSKTIVYNGQTYLTNGGAFMGNTIINRTVTTEFQTGIKPFTKMSIPFDVTTVNAYQIVNPNLLEDFDIFAGKPGQSMLHEVTEAYSGALISLEAGVSAQPAISSGSPTSWIYQKSHSAKTTVSQPGDGVITQNDLIRIRMTKAK